MHQSSKEFKKLQAFWYKKLSRDGFDDAEQSDGNLKRWHKSDMELAYNRRDGHTKQEYFVAAGRFLYDNTWESLVDRKIWELHCEGLSVREIVRELNTVTKSQIHRILQRLIKDMVAKWRK